MPASGTNRTIEIEVVPSDDVVARRAADIVAETLAANPTARISLPTGSTPLKMYQELVARSQHSEIDLSRMELYLLDEYLGQSIDDEASLTNWLKGVFLDPAGLHEHVHFIPSTADDPDAAAAAYDRALTEAGGLDLAILGLGPNGHIAFNEPGSAADSRTRVLDLTEESRNQSAAYWDGKETIPTQAMTMGVATLLEARRLVLIVTGASKAEILRDALEGPMTADVPASWLRLAADRLEVIVDEPAAALLARS
jgi:glucosamine-6-phosphate deaminase